MNATPLTLRSQVRVWRERAHLRPSELARLVGLSRQALHSIETGEYVPNTATALHLARVLGCTVEDLFCLGEAQVSARWVAPQASTQGPNQVSIQGRARLAQVGEQWLAFGVGGLAEVADGTVLQAAIQAAGPQAESQQVQVKLFGDLDLPRRTAVLAGCDPSLALLSTHVSRQRPDTRLLLSPVSSLEALRALARGEAHAAGIHLWDAASGESNWPPAQRELAGRPAQLFTLWTWEQGLMVAAGNPRGITGVADLLRPDLRLQNREASAGSRVLLELWLDQAKVSRQARRAIVGYREEARTPLEAAGRVAAGQADVAVGPRSAALALGLGFVPLQTERFDLVIPDEHREHPALLALLEVVGKASFRSELVALGGYDPAHAGERWKTLGGTS